MRDVRKNDYSNLQSFIRGAILVPNRMDMAWKSIFAHQLKNKAIFQENLLFKAFSLHYIFHAFWTLGIVKFKNSLKNSIFQDFSNN